MLNDIRVLVADSSSVFCNFLKSELSSVDGIEVIDTANSAEELKNKISRLNPDVVTVDTQITGMKGIEDLKRAVPSNVPVIIITASDISSVTAMGNGAVEVVKKPLSIEKPETDKFIVRVATVIRYAKIIKTKPRKPPQKAVEGPSVPLTIPGTPRKNIVIALGASTGGTDALVEVVKHLPSNTPPVLITQHMPPTFTKMFAERIDRISPMRAKEAEDGDRLEQGLIIVAAGGNQMRLFKDARGYYITSRPGEKVSGHCPSVDVLFSSVAEVAGPDAIGAILTGMGADGAAGLLKMRQAGAYTIGQDEETCVVYGMPGVAFKNGAVMTQLPLQKIAEHIISKVK